MESIGLLELFVLIVVGQNNRSYGSEVHQKIVQYWKRSIQSPQVHAILRRLEKKKLIKSHNGHLTSSRGAHAKVCFSITEEGNLILQETLTSIDLVRAKIQVFTKKDE